MPNLTTVPRDTAKSMRKASHKTDTEVTRLPRLRKTASPMTSIDKWIAYRDAFLASPASNQIQEIRQGVRASYLLGLAEAAQVPREDIFRLIGLPLSTAKRKLAKDEKLDSSATERLTRIGAIEKLAEETLGDASLAREWLRTNNIGLGNTTPLSMLDTDIGSREVSRILNAIAYGGVA